MRLLLFIFSHALSSDCTISWKAFSTSNCPDVVVVFGKVIWSAHQRVVRALRVAALISLIARASAKTSVGRKRCYMYIKSFEKLFAWIQMTSWKTLKALHYHPWAGVDLGFSTGEGAAHHTSDCGGGWGRVGSPWASRGDWGMEQEASAGRRRGPALAATISGLPGCVGLLLFYWTWWTKGWLQGATVQDARLSWGQQQQCVGSSFLHFLSTYPSSHTRHPLPAS